MHEDGDMQNYYSTVFTLKNGVQIKIFHKKPYNEIAKVEFTDTKRLVIEGFISTPLVIKKSVKIRCDEIAAVETTNELHLFNVHWEGTELDTRSSHQKDCDCPVCNFLRSNDHSEDCNCQECYYRKAHLSEAIV